ncbi:MAG: LysR substrate-binding domain-containing protein [Bacteroidota bacterium]
MNFQQLNYILAVEKHQNFHRAAIACEVAQSTLSREIQRLEQEYQIIIFDRTRHPVVPTLKGLDLLRKAKDILAHQKEFIRIAHKRDNEITGNMNLAITEILAPYITPKFIYSLAQKYPDLELNILELSDRRIEDLLIEEEIDAAIMISPSLTHEYYESKIYKEEILLYSTQEIPDHTDGKINLSSIDLKEVLIHEDLKDILQRQLNSELNKLSPSPGRKIKYLKGNLETLRNIVNHNGGSMLLPKIAIPYFPDNQRQRIYSFLDSQPELDVSLISARGFEKNRIIKRLTEEILRIVPKEKLI